MDPGDDTVIRFRLDHGLCHGCGTPVYQVVDDVTDSVVDERHVASDSCAEQNINNSNNKNVTLTTQAKQSCLHPQKIRRLVPLTVEGVVKAGRCLYCYPDRQDIQRNQQPQRGYHKPPQESRLQDTDEPRAATMTKTTTPTSTNASKSVKQEDYSSEDEIRAFESKNSTTINCSTQHPKSQTSDNDDGSSRDHSDDDDELVCENRFRPTVLEDSQTRLRQEQAEMDLKPAAKGSQVLPLEEMPRSHDPRDSDDDGDEPVGNSRCPTVLDDSKKRSRQQAEIDLKPAARTTTLTTSTTVARRSARRRTSHDIRAATAAQGHDDGVYTSIQDAEGIIFSGMVLKGTSEKGEGKFSHKYTEAGRWAGKVATYEGEFANGVFEGQGKQVDAAGCIYEGSFRNGASNGWGRCEWPCGWIYEGEWKDDLREGHGSCRQRKKNGEVYEGKWKADMWHGKGKLTFALGDVYKGDFRENKIHGKGRYQFSDGSLYKGEFENDCRHGYGRMKYSDGNYYKGSWRNNWRDGSGKLRYPDGSVFEGTFRGDELQDGFIRTNDDILRPVKGGQQS